MDTLTWKSRGTKLLRDAIWLPEALLLPGLQMRFLLRFSTSEGGTVDTAKAPATEAAPHSPHAAT